MALDVPACMWVGERARAPPHHMTSAAPPSTVSALRPMRLRSSCSGSLHHVRNVTTSLAIWLMVAGVPGASELLQAVNMQEANRQHR